MGIERPSASSSENVSGLETLSVFPDGIHSRDPREEGSSQARTAAMETPRKGSICILSAGKEQAVDAVSGLVAGQRIHRSTAKFSCGRRTEISVGIAALAVSRKILLGFMSGYDAGIGNFCLRPCSSVGSAQIQAAFVSDADSEAPFLRETREPPEPWIFPTVLESVDMASCLLRFAQMSQRRPFC